MSRNEGSKYDLVIGDVLLAARHDLDCYLEGVDLDSSCSDSLDFINTHLIRAIGDILGIVQLDFGYSK